MPNVQQPFFNELDKYIIEIEQSRNQVVQKLSTLMGKYQVAKYLSYLDKHKTLADQQPPSHSRVGAVLCKDDIEAFCAKDVPLIDYPDKSNYKVEAASYQLRLGSRCRVVDPKVADPQGIVWLSDKQDLHIQPHGIAVVSTYEWINMPGCLIGRWNLKVKKVYDGLVWVGSPQVDPGYQGFLFCPIYNLSNEERILRYKDPLFIIDFVLTTPNKNGKYEIWLQPPDRDKYSTFDFDRLDENRIRSAPQESFKEIDDKLKTFENKSEQLKVNLENKTQHYFEINLVLIGILFTTIGIIAGFGLGRVQWHESWMIPVMAFVALVLSGLAVVISLWARKTKSKAQNNSQQSLGHK